jgi:hypothetical protein
MRLRLAGLPWSVEPVNDFLYEEARKAGYLKRKTPVYCYVVMRPDQLDTKGDEDYWDTSAGYERTRKRHEDHRTRNPQLGKVIMVPHGFLSLMNGPHISNH